MSNAWLIASAVFSILLILFLVMRSKWQAFVALLFTSFVLGLLSGMPVNKIIESVQFGMSDTLGFVAIVIGLGAMFGRMLEVSGGAERLAGAAVLERELDLVVGGVAGGADGGADVDDVADKRALLDVD